MPYSPRSRERNPLENKGEVLPTIIITKRGWEK